MFGDCPNIIGSLAANDLGNVPVTYDPSTLLFAESLVTGRTSGDSKPVADWATFDKLSFDASRSSTIYSGTTIQPNALNCLPCIRC